MALLGSCLALDAVAKEKFSNNQARLELTEYKAISWWDGK